MSSKVTRNVSRKHVVLAASGPALAAEMAGGTCGPASAITPGSEPPEVKGDDGPIVLGSKPGVGSGNQSV